MGLSEPHLCSPAGDRRFSGRGAARPEPLLPTLLTLRVVPSACLFASSKTAVCRKVCTFYLASCGGGVKLSHGWLFA